MDKIVKNEISSLQSSAVVIIPVYKTRNLLTKLEERSLIQCISVLDKHQICFVCPMTLDVNDYLKAFSDAKFQVERFNDYYFSSIQGYNNLMLSKEFYQRFSAFDFILIHQLDAYVFRDDLNYWCEQDYDYIGAPWLTDRRYKNKWKQKWKGFVWNQAYKKNKLNRHSDFPADEQFHNKVGNGGFSLRRVSKMIEILDIFSDTVKLYLQKSGHPHFNEDVFWSLEVNRKKTVLKIPDYKIAIFFAIETWPEIAFELTNGQLPFGCHDWDKYYDFWKEKIKS